MLLRGDETVVERVEHAIDSVCGDDFYAPAQTTVADRLIIIHAGKMYLLKIEELGDVVA